MSTRKPAYDVRSFALPANFVDVTEAETGDSFVLNLNDVSYFRRSAGYTVVGFRSDPKLTIRIREKVYTCEG